MNSGEIGATRDRGGECSAGIRDAGWVVVWAGIVAAAMFGSRAIFSNTELPAWVRALGALMPVAPFAGMMWAMVRASRRLDEMWSRVQLEALAATVVLTAGVCAGWGQLQKAGFMATTEVSGILPVLAVSYVLCYAAAAWRRFA